MSKQHTTELQMEVERLKHANSIYQKAIDEILSLDSRFERSDLFDAQQIALKADNEVEKALKNKRL